VAWTLRLDPPDDEKICVGVTAREYMSVIWADWLLVIDQSEGLGSREYMQTDHHRSCVSSNIVWTTRSQSIHFKLFTVKILVYHLVLSNLKRPKLSDILLTMLRHCCGLGESSVMSLTLK